MKLATIRSVRDGDAIVSFIPGDPKAEGKNATQTDAAVISDADTKKAIADISTQGRASSEKMASTPKMNAQIKVSNARQKMQQAANSLNENWAADLLV